MTQIAILPTSETGCGITIVRLKLEQHQLVGSADSIGCVLVELEGA